MAEDKPTYFDFVIVGGGVAGVSCVENIAENNPNATIALVTISDIVKCAVTLRKLTEIITEIDAEEKDVSFISKAFSNVTVIRGKMKCIWVEDHCFSIHTGSKYSYGKICLCTGGKPNIIHSDNRYVLGIRDVDSVANFKDHLRNAKRVVIVGNGGIALELVYEIKNCEVIWVMKDDHIGSVFFGKEASAFLFPQLCNDSASNSSNRKADQTVFKRKRYAVERECLPSEGCSGSSHGSALGPDWNLKISLTGTRTNLNSDHDVHIEHNCEITSIKTIEESTTSKQQEHDNYNISVKLSNGKTWECDLVLSATGVCPNLDFEIISNNLIELSNDGGIAVNHSMRTNLIDVYAAGDACHASWDKSKHWFQMRLWSQASQMGAYAARCMVNDTRGINTTLDFCFELFTHVTTFLGYKICLLGIYDGDKHSDFKSVVRCTEGKEYIKVLFENGRVQGVVLIGETDLEETFENLILNQMDLHEIQDSILDHDLDLEDYFD